MILCPTCGTTPTVGFAKTSHSITHFCLCGKFDLHVIAGMQWFEFLDAQMGPDGVLYGWAHGKLQKWVPTSEIPGGSVADMVRLREVQTLLES